MPFTTMTTRDYMAAQAITGKCPVGASPADLKALADTAYMVADAMLVAAEDYRKATWAALDRCAREKGSHE